MSERRQGPTAGARRSRAEDAAATIATAAQRAAPGARLGSREDLRATCDVSVGTLHEALRLLQATGEIVVRPGPGGGVFAGERSALSAMLRDVHRLGPVEPDVAQAFRVLDALVPLILDDAIRALDADGTRRLTAGLAGLVAASDADLRTLLRASLEVFATIVALPPTGLLAVMTGSLLRTQISALQDVVAPIDPDWRALVDRHVDAVSRMVHALLERDLDRALSARREPGFVALFAALDRERRG